MLFKRTETPTEAPVTGSSIIRAALRAKNKKVNLAPMARDLSLPVNTLESYADGSVATLSPEVMQKVVSYIWSNGTVWDSENDLLVAPDKVAGVLGQPSPPWTPPPDFVVATPELRSTPLPTPRHLASYGGTRPGWK